MVDLVCYCWCFMFVSSLLFLKLWNCVVAWFGISLLLLVGYEYALWLCFCDWALVLLIIFGWFVFGVLVFGVLFVDLFCLT